MIEDWRRFFYFARAAAVRSIGGGGGSGGQWGTFFARGAPALTHPHVTVMQYRAALPRNLRIPSGPDPSQVSREGGSIVTGSLLISEGRRRLPGAMNGGGGSGGGGGGSGDKDKKGISGQGCGGGGGGYGGGGGSQSPKTSSWSPGSIGQQKNSYGNKNTLCSKGLRRDWTKLLLV